MHIDIDQEIESNKSNEFRNTTNKIHRGRHPKPLNDLTEKIHIQANGSQILHVVFSDSDFASTPISKGSHRYACISTLESLSLNDRYENTASYLPYDSDDTFSDGEYVIRISIYSDEGPSKSKLFLLHVDQNYKKIDMKSLSRKNKIMLRFGLPLIL